MAVSSSLRIKLLLAPAAKACPSIASIVSVGPTALYTRGPRALSSSSGIKDVHHITDAINWESKMAMNRAGIGRIVVGVDGSEHSEAAIKWAARMAKGMDSEVIAVFAVAPPVYFDGGFLPPVPPPQFDAEWLAGMKNEFEAQWCKSLRDAGVRYRAIMEDGRPASVIAQVADSVNADVIVVGRRGRGGVAELVLGSVSHELVLHSKRPILVISTDPPSQPTSQAKTSRPHRSAAGTKPVTGPKRASS
jgi:nucleotide-binding universal stress UspA family protein